jgi:hypothetical protein
VEVHLLDPGMIGAGGHNTDWNIQIANRVADLGHSICIYANKRAKNGVERGMQPAVGFQPHFRMDPYLSPQKIDPVSGQIEKYLIGADLIAKDLQLIPDADLWIWPTVFAHQMMGCAEAKPRVPMSFGLHYPPQLSAAWWRIAAKRFHSSGHKVRTIGCILPELVSGYREILTGMDPVVLPVPIDGTPLCHTSLRTVGLLGKARPEKGRQHYQGIVKHCLQRGFHVLVQDDSVLQIKQKLSPRTECISYQVSFDALVSRCDLVVVPYDREKYRERGSGIVWQAMASGTPCVAPSEASFSTRLQQQDSAILYNGDDTTAILRAIDRAADNYTLLGQAASEAAQQWQQTQGIARYVAAMLG